MLTGTDFHYISPNDIRRENGFRRPGTYIGGKWSKTVQTELDWLARAVEDPREVAALVDLLSTFRDGEGWTPLRWDDLQGAVRRANSQVNLLAEDLGFIDSVWNQYTPFRDSNYSSYEPPTWLRRFLPAGEMWQTGTVASQWYVITEKGKRFLEEHE